MAPDPLAGSLSATDSIDDGSNCAQTEGWHVVVDVLVLAGTDHIGLLPDADIAVRLSVSGERAGDGAAPFTCGETLTIKFPEALFHVGAEADALDGADPRKTFSAKDESGFGLAAALIPRRTGRAVQRRLGPFGQAHAGQFGGHGCAGVDGGVDADHELA